MRFYLAVILIFLCSTTIEDITNRAIYRFEVRLNLDDRDFRPRPDRFYQYEPSRAATCDDFVGLIVDNFLNSPEERSHIGGNMLNSRDQRLGGIQDFREELVGGGQDTALSQHINGHAGALLRYGFAGQIVSLSYMLIDQGQRLDPEPRSFEVDAEIAGNFAGRKVAALIQRASKDWQRVQTGRRSPRSFYEVSEGLSTELDKVLCDKSGALAAHASLDL
jgi:hypothetical protein